jgi:FkbM family methyltransferase
MTTASDGSHEYMLLQLLRPSDVVVDIGAARGVFTEAALARGAQVIAVEPDRDRCKQLQKQSHDRCTVVHAAIGGSDGTAAYVPRVRRTLTTNARDAVTVRQIRLSTLWKEYSLPEVAVLRIRAAGHLQQILSSTTLLSAAASIHLVGDACLGDDPTALLTAASAMTLRCLSITDLGTFAWDTSLPHYPAKINLLLQQGNSSLADAKKPTADELAALARIEGHAVDPTRRARIAALLHQQHASNAALHSDERDLLGELLLDPNPEVAASTRWWREQQPKDHRLQAQQRLAAFERLTDRLTGPRKHRPSPFASLR